MSLFNATELHVLKWLSGKLHIMCISPKLFLKKEINIRGNGMNDTQNS